jgi:hypothetical protein
MARQPVSRKAKPQHSKHDFKLGREPWRALLGSPVTQFGGDNDAGTNFPFANLADALRHFSLRVADEIRNEVVSSK